MPDPTLGSAARYVPLFTPEQAYGLKVHGAPDGISYVCRGPVTEEDLQTARALEDMARGWSPDVEVTG